MKRKHIFAAGIISLFAANLSAQELSISVTNLTQGIHFTPLIASSHSESASIFNLATAASTELQALAEGGDISGVSTMLTAMNGDVVENPAMGLLAPAATTTFELSTSDGNGYLSIAAMMLPTNDGFVGLNSWEIPTTAGTYTILLNAYDAGTEANDEIINGGGAPGTPGIPAAPGGNAGMNATGLSDAQSNANVHVHRGALGDDDLTGGTSDLDNRVHRWLNPVAKVTITVE
jgi:hypothetical protein